MTEPKEPSFKTTLGYRFSRLHRLQLALCRKGIQDSGLLPSQCPFIAALVKESGPVTQDYLSGRVMVDKGTTARAVGQLEKKGFLHRRPNPENRRQNLILATPKAHDAARHLIGSLEKAAAVFLEGFTPEDRALALALMDRMILNAEGKLNEN